MAIIQIPNLPAVIGLSGSELFEGVQSGSSFKISLAQITAYLQLSNGMITLPIQPSAGGTGLTSYTVGDIIYASGTTTLAKLSDIATGNALITGGVGAAPSYGKIGLTTHVSGTLPVANGGTNITSYTVGAIPYASASGVLSQLLDVATGNALISGGVGVAPSYGKIGLTTHISGTLPVANGGTNITSYTAGDIIYASTSGVLSRLADIATGNALISGGVGAAPSYGKIGLTTHVSGILPAANGGTGVTTAPAEAARILGYTATATAAGTTVFTNTSTQYQLFTGSTTQTITLPVTSTLATGWSFHIVNNSTGNLTVNSSGGNLVVTIIPGVTAMVTCIGTTLTTAADWEPGITDFSTITGTGSAVLGTGPTITGAALNGTVGATTPSTGAFTTLSASSTVSGTGFSTYLASPPAIGSTAASTGAFTTVTATTSVLSSGAGGIGYSTGAGVAVTQLTSRTTPAPTTGNKTTGAVTLFTAAAVVGTYFSFTVPNTAIAVTDTVVLSVRGATNTYVAFVTAITAATSFQVTMASVVGTASDTPIVNFTIIRGVSA